MADASPGPGAPRGPGPGWWVRAAGVGVAAGLLSGLFGVGGGIIMVPLLVVWFALDQRRASATSLLAIVPIALASTLGYAVNGNVDVRAGLLLLLGGITGGQLGAWLLPRTPIPTLQLWFGILSIATAVRMVMADPAGGGFASGALEAVLLVLVGVAAGVLAGLLGVGGGIIMVPGLVLVAGEDPDTARGTSLLVVIGTAITATVTNARNDLVEMRLGVVAGLAGAPAGLAGAAIGQWLPQRIALGLFALLLAWSGLRMLLRSSASRRTARSVQRPTPSV